MIVGRSGCQRRPFRVQVYGTAITKVAFKLDARTVKTLRRPNRGKRYSLLVAPLKLRRGAHRVTATVTFAPASLTKPKRLRVTFRHCARPAAPSSSR